MPGGACDDTTHLVYSLQCIRPRKVSLRMDSLFQVPKTTTTKRPITGAIALSPTWLASPLHHYDEYSFPPLPSSKTGVGPSAFPSIQSDVQKMTSQATWYPSGLRWRLKRTATQRSGTYPAADKRMRHRPFTKYQRPAFSLGTRYLGTERVNAPLCIFFSCTRNMPPPLP